MTHIIRFSPRPRVLAQWQKFNFLKISLFCDDCWVSGRPWATFLSLSLRTLHWSWSGQTQPPEHDHGRPMSLPCELQVECWLQVLSHSTTPFSGFRGSWYYLLWKCSPLWSESAIKCDFPGPASVLLVISSIGSSLFPLIQGQQRIPVCAWGGLV